MKRRKFIHQASCAAVGSTTFFSSLLNLKAANAAAIANSSVQQANDYKALVCILLQGGNDSYNMIMPRTGTPYDEYARTRTNNAVRSQDMLPISPKISDGRDLGLHPSLSNLKRMYDEGKVAFLNNIGTLVEPTTPDNFFLENVNLPLGLLSHSDQVQHWQTAFPQDRAALGWGGKMSELILDMNNNQSISMNISLAGSNVFQTGRNTTSYTMDSQDGPVGMLGYNEDEYWTSVIKKSIDNLIDKSYTDVFEKSYVDVIRNSRDSFVQFSDALNSVTPEIYWTCNVRHFLSIFQVGIIMTN